MTAFALLPTVPPASNDLGRTQRGLGRAETQWLHMPFRHALEPDAVGPCLEVDDLRVVGDDEALQSILFRQEVHQRLDLLQGKEVVRLVKEECGFPPFE